MSREYTTILRQTIYDVTVQKFGSLDDLDQVMRAAPSINSNLPFRTLLVLNDTEDELAKRFNGNNVYIATGAKSYEVPRGITYGIAHSIP